MPAGGNLRDQLGRGRVVFDRVEQMAGGEPEEAVFVVHYPGGVGGVLLKSRQAVAQLSGRGRMIKVVEQADQGVRVGWGRFTNVHLGQAIVRDEGRAPAV